MAEELPIDLVSVPEEPVIVPIVKRKRKKKPGVSYPNRLLAALADIYEDETSDKKERIQAIRMSLEAMTYRKPPKRKTDRDKAVIQSLQKPKPTALDKPGEPAKIYPFQKRREPEDPTP